MYKSILLILLVFIGQSLVAQNYNYQWTIAGGSSGIDNGTGVATDNLKNVFSVGNFTGTVDFDPSAATNNLVATGNSSGYIVKYDSLGTMIWCFSINASVSASCSDVCTDIYNNVYIIGEVNGVSGDFDPDTGVANIVTAGLSDVYIAKYSSAGQLIWLLQIGGSQNEYARKIKAGLNNELIVSGNFEGSVDFDPTINTNFISSAGSTDVFLMRLKLNGTVDWVKTIGNSGGNQGPSIGIDELGCVYSVGSFSGTLDTDPDPINTNLLSASGNAIDGVIIKLDSNGVFLWSHNLNSNSAALINDVVADNDNNIYLTGWFSGYVDFDPSNALDTFVNVSGIDAFVWKMTSGGQHIWVKKVGNSQPEFFDGRAVKIDINGNPIVLGIFEGSADFDPSAAIKSLTSLGDFDVFVWSLNANGKFLFSEGIGGVGKDVSADLYLDKENNLYYSGFFSSTTDFNPWLGTSIFTPPSNFADFHVTKWSFCAPTTSSISIVSCDSSYSFNGQNYDSAGTYVQTLINSHGCDSVITLQLSFSIIDTTVLANGIDLSAVQMGANYQWYECDSVWTPISGANQSSYSVGQYGHYALVLSMNGCVDTSTCILVYGLGFNEHANDYSITISPNPTNNVINLKWNQTFGNRNIQLFNSLGMLVKELEVHDSFSTSMEVDLPTGLYFLRIIVDDKLFTLPVQIVRSM